MKKLLFVLMLGLFAIFSSCEKSNEVDFLFKETYCANPWDTIASPEWTREQLVSYYLSNQLEVEFSDLSIASDGVVQDCEACHCLSGDNIRISADEEFTDILLENGFEIDE